MKKLCAVLLALLICATPVAFAQSNGNLNNGAFIDEASGVRFLAVDEGILRLEDGAAKPLCADRAEMLQITGERLYYLSDVYAENEYGEVTVSSQTPISMALDGSDRRTLGAPRAVGQTVDYEGFTYDTFVGYRGFTVYGDRIYFLGNGAAGGAYTCHMKTYDENNVATEQSQQVTYQAGISLFSMALDGADVRELIPNIGNNVAAFAIANDKIFLGAGFADMLYAYNYVNYGIYDLSGKQLTAIGTANHKPDDLWSEAGVYYHIPDAVLTDGETLYASLCESEGDFRASQLYALAPDGQLSPVLIQESYVKSVLAGDGSVCYVGSAATSTGYDEAFDYNASLGLYCKALTDQGLGRKLLALPDNDYLYSFQLDVLGDTLYFVGHDRVVYRIPLAGGQLEKFDGSDFVPAEFSYVSTWIDA